GVIPWHMVALALAMWSAISVLNICRTMVTHHYANDTGEPLEVVAQVLDSASVPPPALLPMLWAPVGLRYHALHHLLPSVPYHNLGEAHRRLCKELDERSVYHHSTYRHLTALVARLARSTMGRRTA